MSLEKEKETLRSMIHLFCRGQEHKNPLCDNCSELLTYALERLERCPYGEDKPTCKQCPVHCYRPDMRDRVTQVMRYAGPRMLLHHPVQGIRHLMHEKRSRPNDQKTA